ncbi:hypothetical protein SMICM304S_03069 [Streptomyces microflavus]
MDHHRGVHTVERSGLQEERLARPALGGGADHPDGQAEFVGVRGEAECRADPGGGDQVVAAGVAEAGERVVLAGDGDGDGPRADRGPEGRLQAVGGCGDLEAVRGEEFGVKAADRCSSKAVSGSAWMRRLRSSRASAWIVTVSRTALLRAPSRSSATSQSCVAARSVPGTVIGISWRSGPPGDGRLHCRK